MADRAIRLAQPHVPQDVAASIRPSRSSRWMRSSFAGIKPDRLSTIITKAERGDLEDWADLCAFMLRDPDVRSATDTRSLAIVGAEIVVEPGHGAPGMEQAAEEGAEWVREMFASTPDVESVITGLMHAENVGWSLGAHDWHRVAGEWRSTPDIVEPRDVRFKDDWTVQVRTYDDKAPMTGRWLDVAAFKPGSFIQHVPRKHDRPTVAGDFHAIVWTWLFKRWMEVFRQEGMEKFASPFVVGRVPPNSPAEVRARLKEALENLSADQIAVIEDGSAIEYQESSSSPGDRWTDVIDHQRRTLIKLLLGSDLNVEVGSTGGNRALGESQFTTTILPRLTAIGNRLGSTLARDWAAPALRMNAHRFGGYVVPTPRVWFRLVQDEPMQIPQYAIDAAAVTVDEVRRSFEAEEWGPERGGDRIVQPLAKTSPGFSRIEAAGEVAAHVPFGRQLRLPMTGRRPRTSATSSDSRSQIASVPFPPSGGRVKR